MLCCAGSAFVSMSLLVKWLASKRVSDRVLLCGGLCISILGLSCLLQYVNRGIGPCQHMSHVVVCLALVSALHVQLSDVDFFSMKIHICGHSIWLYIQSLGMMS